MNGHWKRIAVWAGALVALVTLVSFVGGAAWRGVSWMQAVDTSVGTTHELRALAPSTQLHLNNIGPGGLHLTVKDRNQLRRMEDIELMLRWLVRNQGASWQAAVEDERLRTPVHVERDGE